MSNFSTYMEKKPVFIINDDNTSNQLSAIKQSRENLYKPENIKKDKPNIYNDIYEHNIIRSNNTKQNQNKSEEKYDPLLGYLHKQGLLNNNNSDRYEVEYVIINSANRQKKTLSIKNTYIDLERDPFELIYNSNILKINHKNHNFSVSDRISISGLHAQSIKLLTPGNVNIDIEEQIIERNEDNDITNIYGQFRVQVEIKNLFEFRLGSNYMTIYYTHNIPVSSVYKRENNGLIYSNDLYLDTLDTTNLIIELSGIKNNTLNNQYYYDNIPLNMINNKHNIILKNPYISDSDYLIIKPNVFYVKLPIIYNTVFIPPASPYNFNLIYYYTGGVPHEYINSDFPINSSFLQGFQTIDTIDKNSYTIILNSKSTGTTNINTGGNQIKVNLLTDINLGYSLANNYMIELNKIYTNIVLLNIVESTFPNSQQLINKNNNKIYWQNIEDGDNIYSITITPGNYNIITLCNNIQELFSQVIRINTTITKLGYNNNNIINVAVDESTKIISFTSYKVAVLYKPIISIDPEITLNSDDLLNTNYTISIKHPNHGLNVGMSIKISNMISHLGISFNILNNIFIIQSIVDENVYIIQLPKFNLDTLNKLNTQGGGAVNILVPNLFRFRFDYANTCGNILGFNNVGNILSITPYSNIIKNIDLYETDTLIDSFGNAIYNHNNNGYNLNVFNYILMTCDKVNNMKNLGQSNIIDVFSKIVFNSDISYNTFVPTTKIFNDPLDPITELGFCFYNPDGTLYDFNGQDHSFTLQIISKNNIPDNTHISGKNPSL